MLTKALTEGLIWAVLWMIYVYMLLKFFPWTMVHDYPEDIRKAYTGPTPTERQQRTGKLVSGVYALFLLVLLSLFGFEAFHGRNRTYWELFVFLWVVVFVWNLLDLLVMDWLIVCTITPDWLILEGTKGCKGYKDYAFHGKGFLIGCGYTTLTAAVFAGLDMLLLSL